MDILKLVASLVLDSSKYDRGLAEAEGSANSFATFLGTGMAGATATLFTAAAAGVATVGASVVTLTKQATSAYGEYEQLAGGIETLFGEAAPKVMEDAANAFSDAGMSINKYMETSIQSAAALINSLEGDQDKAAELMNMSIIDMSDNVNKMGTTMEAVQNAYRGFSRGNFTMLDNLALGFSGTKQGMEELLEKAKEISGVEYDIESYADIVQAIHVVQEEMGISGTTMKEAGSTITGSLGAVKAAWENLITGLANENADVGDLFDKLLTSIFGENGQGGFLSNMMPRIEQALKGIVEFIKVGAERLPEVAVEILPDLIGSFTEVLMDIVTSLSENSDEIIENLAELFQIMIENALTAISAIIQALPIVFEIALKLILALATGIAEALPDLIPVIIDVLQMIVDTLLENIPLILDAAEKLIIGLATGILGNLDKISLAALDIMWRLMFTILSLIPQLIEIAFEIVGEFIGALAEGIFKMLTAEYFVSALHAIADAFLSIDWIKIGLEMLEGIVEGFTKGLTKVVDGARNVANSIKNVFTGEMDIHSPSKVFEQYGEMIDEGLAIGIDSGQSVDAIKNMTDNVTGAFSPSLAGAGGGDFIIPIYIGDEPIQTVVIKAMDLANYRSGGR